MKLSLRLQKIVDLLADNSVIADVGTDHGFLAIGAVQQGKARLAYATDLNAGPLQTAADNVAHSGLEAQIVTVLSDGLAFLAEPMFASVHLDYCVIAGLGSTTIADILARDSGRVAHYVLCANTPIGKLRQWTQARKFAIVHEDFFYDHDKPYWLVVVNKSQPPEPLDDLEVEYGQLRWFATNAAYRQYLQAQLAKLQALSQQPGAADNPEIAKTITQLKEYLRRWN